MTNKHYTIPIFIPELACPFQCVFCDQRKITGKNQVPDEDAILQTIESHLQSFKEENRIVEIGFFGGSFTGIPMDQQEKYLSLIQHFIKKKLVNAIRLSTRPDYINAEVLALLKKFSVETIELGAQSFDDEVLNQSFRGHTAQQTVEASKAILKHGFQLGLQMMIGLPGDTFEKSMNTAKRIVELGAGSTRIYPTVVIKDTALHQWYKQGKYKPLDLEEAVDWTKHLLLYFEEKEVKVLRVGLHPSEGILCGDDLIAGPFHPSFKELVLTEIWGDILKSVLNNEGEQAIVIHVPEKEINYAIGNQSRNRKMLAEKFGSVKIVPDKSLLGRDYEIVEIII